MTENNENGLSKNPELQILNEALADLQKNANEQSIKIGKLRRQLNLYIAEITSLDEKINTLKSAINTYSELKNIPNIETKIYDLNEQRRVIYVHHNNIISELVHAELNLNVLLKSPLAMSTEGKWLDLPTLELYQCTKEHILSELKKEAVSKHSWNFLFISVAAYISVNFISYSNWESRVATNLGTVAIVESAKRTRRLNMIKNIEIEGQNQ
jgi:hypothetical protein